MFRVIALMIFCSCFTLAQFEGIIESRNVTTDETGGTVEYQMTMWIGRDMVKVKTTSLEGIPGNTMIYRNDKNVIWMFAEGEKSYVEIDQSEQPVQQYAATPEEKYKVRRTGKKKTILGYLCEEIILTRESEKTTIWATAKLKRLNDVLAKAFGGENGHGPQAWDDELSKFGLYPLKATILVDGHIAESQEVTAISEKKLPVELFQVPADFEKQNMGKMFDGMEEGK